MSTVSRTPIWRRRSPRHGTIRTVFLSLLIAVFGCLLVAPSSDAATPFQYPPCQPDACIYQPSEIVYRNNHDLVPYRQLAPRYNFGPEFRRAAKHAYVAWRHHHSLSSEVAGRLGVNPDDCTAACWWYHTRATLNCVHQSYNEMGPTNGCEANPSGDDSFRNFMRNPVTKFTVLCGGGALFTYGTAGEGAPITAAFLAREAKGCGVGWFLGWTYEHIFS